MSLLGGRHLFVLEEAFFNGKVSRNETTSRTMPKFKSGLLC